MLQSEVCSRLQVFRKVGKALKLNSKYILAKVRGFEIEGDRTE